MSISKWYKKFGDDRDLTYYHIVDLDEENGVSGTCYTYNTLIKKVVARKQVTLDSKWWMEQEIKNNIHQIPEDTIPFLMKF